MINQVRTLLMNRGREGHGLTEFGEEYISPDFIPRVLNGPLKLVQRTLFGSKPDRLFLNYRMRQIMQLMHASPMRDDITQDDPRITYLPFKTDLFEQAFAVTISLINGPAIMVHAYGDYVSNMSAGLTKQLWDVEVTGANEVTVTKRYGRPETQVLTIIGDAPVPLIGSGLTVLIHQAPIGFHIQVSATARPAMDVSQLLNGMTSALGQTGLSDIFPVMPPEPVATWQVIYNTYPATVMRFTALLLAISYRTAQMPQESTNV